MEDKRRYERNLARFMWGGFYHCPNSERVIASLKNDDKVLCGCGKVNPRCPTEPPGHHVVSFLKAATVDEFLDYEEKPYGRPE